MVSSMLKYCEFTARLNLVLHETSSGYLGFPRKARKGGQYSFIRKY